MVCKIKGIKAVSTSANSYTSIATSLIGWFNYVRDEEKMFGAALTKSPVFTKYTLKDLEGDLLNLDHKRTISSLGIYRAELKRIVDTYISGYLCDPELAISQFMLTKVKNLSAVNKTLHDDLGNQGFHIVQSFPDDLTISDEEVHQCGVELCEKIKVHQAVITSHLHPIYDDSGILHGNCKHNHILINSHIHPEFIDPDHPERMKYHDCKETYAQLRAWNDEIAIEHGLPVIIPSKDAMQCNWYLVEMTKQGKSWLKKTRDDLDQVIKVSYDWDEYKAELYRLGYGIQEGTYETYITPDKKHKVRGIRLGEKYKKKNILLQLEKNREVKQIGLKKQPLKSTFPKDNTNKNGKEAISDVSVRTIQSVFEFIDCKSDVYHIEIPRTNQLDGSRYYFKLYLLRTIKSFVVNHYIEDDEAYDIYDDKRKNYGKVSGRVLKEMLCF